uniref:Uncharacterized protein n=1 Tax=Rhipicephalus microplus TaxID=6941 RepID=A0A6G5AGL6_RHIMP
MSVCNPSVEHHPIAKFLEAAKVKSANFSDIIHLRSICLRIEAALFLSSLKSFQGSGSLPWLGTCALKPTQSSNGQRRIFSSPLQGSRDAVPFVLHLLSLWLPHQQCNKCAPTFFASPA